MRPPSLAGALKGDMEKQRASLPDIEKPRASMAGETEKPRRRRSSQSHARRYKSLMEEGPTIPMPEVQSFSRQQSAWSRQASAWDRQASAFSEFTEYDRQVSHLSMCESLYSVPAGGELVTPDDVIDLVCDAVQRCCETGADSELLNAQKVLDRQKKLGELHFKALSIAMRSTALTETVGEVERVLLKTSSSGTEHVQYKCTRRLTSTTCFDWLCGLMVARFGCEPGNVVDAVLAVDTLKANLCRETPAAPGEKKDRRDEVKIEEETERTVESWMEWLLDAALHSFAVGDVADDEFERLVFELHHSQIPAGHVASLRDDAQVRLVDKAIKAGNVKWFSAKHLAALRSHAGLAAATYLLPKTATLKRDVAEAAAAAAIKCA